MPASAGTQNEWMTSLRLEREVHRPADRQIQLVRRHDGVDVAVRARSGVLRVAELPPPLVADHLDLQRVGASRRLRLEDRADRRDGDHDQDEERDHGPRDLQRGVAVNVLGLRLTWAAADT